jgi:hypothetical protein
MVINHRERLGWHRSLDLRMQLEDLGLNHDGCTSREVRYADSIRDDMWSVNVIRHYKAGKIIMWVWLKTGLVTPELLAEWWYDGDLQSLEEDMKGTKKHNIKTEDQQTDV